MSSGFTSSTSKQTQSTTLPQAGQMENNLYDQLASLSNQQAGSLTNQNAVQKYLMNPQQALLDYQKTLDPTNNQADKAAIEAEMRRQFGNDLVDQFNASGGTGQGMNTADFQKIAQAQRAFAGSDLRDTLTPDMQMKLQQQIAQNQAAQQAQAQQLTRMQNPYGLTSEEQQGINDVYGQAQNRAMNDMNLQFQDMITSRGLNRYDTPAAEPLARNMGLMLGDIGAQRSAALLNRGEANRNFGMNQIMTNANLGQMQFNNGLMLNQMTPGATNSLLQPLLQQRMAQATTTSSGSQTPSPYDTMMRGIGTAGSMIMGAYGGGMLGGAGGLGLSGGGAPIGGLAGGTGEVGGFQLR